MAAQDAVRQGLIEQQRILGVQEDGVQQMGVEEILEEVMTCRIARYERDVRQVLGVVRYGERGKYVSESKDLFIQLEQEIIKHAATPKVKIEKPNDYLVQQLVKSADKQQKLSFQMSNTLQLTAYLTQVIQRMQYQSIIDLSISEFYKSLVNNYSSLVKQAIQPKSKVRHCILAVIFSKRISKLARKTRQSLEPIRLQYIHSQLLYSNIYRSYSNSFECTINPNSLKKYIKSKIKPEEILTKLLNTDLKHQPKRLILKPERDKQFLSKLIVNHYNQVYNKVKNINQMVGQQQKQFALEISKLKDIIKQKDQQIDQCFRIIRLLKKKICDILGV